MNIDDLIKFFNDTNQHVFIEAEAKPGRMSNFITEYNTYYGNPTVSMSTDGIIVLKDDANKWGLELRVYFYDKTNIPQGYHVTHNDQYRDNYNYRINSVDVVDALFKKGFKIGLN
ncbi:MAG: hypothetical protein K0S41_883 [Anaerocolumna sp.]|nr:hypothetical protein [Anaerocolumna sp.]